MPQTPFLAGDEGLGAAFSTPAAATQASVVIPANSSQSFISTNVTFTYNTGTIAAASNITCDILVGATKKWSVQAVQNGVITLAGPVSFPPGVAITFQFSAAGAAGTFESVSVIGYYE